MGNFTTGINSFLNMDSKRELHFPYEPSGVYAKMACCNLGFQMRWCAEELERRLERHLAARELLPPLRERNARRILHYHQRVTRTNAQLLLH